MQAQMNQLEAGVEFLKVISHPVRLCIIQKLMNESCNVSNMTECMAMPQSTISTHLQKLRSAGIVACKRSGLEVYYEISHPLVKQLLPLILSYPWRSNR